MDQPAIMTEGLVKQFGENRAVDGISLQIASGGVYGVLGPNGAGKTTTIRMLATLLTPDGGTARVLGHDVVTEARQVRAKVAMTGQFASLDADLTGRENLTLLAQLYGFRGKSARARADELLEAFELTDAATRQVKRYSGGMRRRIDIAGSLVVRPELIFLDEPTTGLDPRSRNQVWEIVRALVSVGTTVLLATQYLEEADQLADRVAVIDRGRLIAEGTTGELKASVGAGALKVRLGNPDQREAAADLLARQLGAEPVRERDSHAVSLTVTEPAAVPHALTQLLDSGIAVAEYSLGQPSLDEVFLALTGEHAPDVSTPGERSEHGAPDSQPSQEVRP